MIGIAWKVGGEESFRDAVQKAALRHKQKFGRKPSHILVDPVTAEGLVVEGLTVVGSPSAGKAYTFLLYHEEERLNENTI